MELQKIKPEAIEAIPNSVTISKEFAEHLATSIISVACELAMQAELIDLPPIALPPILAENNIPVPFDGPWKQNIDTTGIDYLPKTLEGIRTSLKAWNGAIDNDQDGVLRAVLNVVPSWVQIAWNFSNEIKLRAAAEAGETVAQIVSLPIELIDKYAHLSAPPPKAPEPPVEKAKTSEKKA